MKREIYLHWLLCRAKPLRALIFFIFVPQQDYWTFLEKISGRCFCNFIAGNTFIYYITFLRQLNKASNAAVLILSFLVMQLFFKQQLMLPQTLQRVLLGVFIIGMMGPLSAFGQIPDIQGEWEIRIMYSCDGGYQSDGYRVNVTKETASDFSTKVYGGVLRIRKMADNYSFAIEGEKDCIREGVLRYAKAGDTTVLKGAWEARTANRSKLGTGLCCHGVIELVRFNRLPGTETASKEPAPALKQPAPVPAAQQESPTVKETAAVRESPVMKEPVKGDTLHLTHLFFEQNKATLVDEKDGLRELDILISQMKRNPNLRISLEGHTDYGGNANNNIKLSEERVRVLKDYMIANGIESRRIKTKGYGGSRPIVTEDTEEREKNRRVEVIILSH